VAVIFMVKFFQRQRFVFARSTTAPPHRLITVSIMDGEAFGHSSRGGIASKFSSQRASIRTGANLPAVVQHAPRCVGIRREVVPADTLKIRSAGVVGVRSLQVFE
jgi:hypothetical protein